MMVRQANFNKFLRGYRVAQGNFPPAPPGIPYNGTVKEIWDSNKISLLHFFGLLHSIFHRFRFDSSLHHKD